MEPKNPKDLQGFKRVSYTKLPAVGVLCGSLAMMDGAGKYGPYNWRIEGKEILATQYIDACKRHLDAWVEGEEKAPDSKVHHLGHAIACLCMILDAQSGGFLQDDRPKPNPAFHKLLAEFNDFLKEKAEKAEKGPDPGR